MKPEPKEEQKVKLEPIDCPGLRLFDQDASRVAAYREEFLLWIAHKADCSVAKHKYVRDHETQEWYVRHSDCMRKNADGVCANCRSLGRKQGVLKMVIRFAVKHAAARVLNARLFAGKEELGKVLEKLKQSNLYARHQVRMDKILALTDPDLQAFVRASFQHESRNLDAPVHNDFYEAVVRPAMAVNVSRMGNEFSELLSRLSGCLASGRLTEMEEVNGRIAAAALSGRLENHPMIQGLTMSAIRLLEKQASGLEGLRGRPREVSETEYNLVADAGLSFAVAGGNTSLARKFGQKASAGRVAFDGLNKKDLPRPALALRFEGLVKENLDAIDRRLLTVPGVPPRRLFVAFDATYLQPCLSQCSIQGQAALVGGAWHQSQQDHSYYPLDQPFNIHKIDKARTLSFCRMLRIIVSSCASQYDSFCVQGLLPRLDFCVWDPSAVEHVTMSAASMPLSLSASTDSTNYKGNWDTCLEHACSSGNMPLLSWVKTRIVHRGSGNDADRWFLHGLCPVRQVPHI